MYLTKSMTGAGYPAIARQFHRKDHTTALHAVRKITQCAADGGEFRKLLDELASQARALGRAADGKEAVNLMRWPRLFGQNFRFDKWNLCRG
jgi:Bacterial dnaA protein helix-turn-helix